MVNVQQKADTIIITLSPNRSSSWKEIKWALVILSLPALLIALGWLFSGVWIILPFAGVEIALLGFLMYNVCYRNYQKENITIDKTSVTVESGIYQRRSQYTFFRPDCYLSVCQPISPLRNLELSLVDKENSLPIGQFLNIEDREQARATLKKAGLIECSQQWWKR